MVNSAPEDAINNGMFMASCYHIPNNMQEFWEEMAEYQMSLFHEIEARLKDKCDKLADAFDDDADSSSAGQNSTARLPERVKLITEEIEREEAALKEDMYSVDRKFAEYYNALEQILAVLI